MHWRIYFLIFWRYLLEKYFTIPLFASSNKLKNNLLVHSPQNIEICCRRSNYLKFKTQYINYESLLGYEVKNYTVNDQSWIKKLYFKIIISTYLAKSVH